MTIEADQKHAGFEELLAGSLFNTIWRRRTHRVSRGVPIIDAGSMTYRSEHAPHPLDELEEAVLIAATGCSRLTMPDRPFQDPATEEFIMAKPNLTMDGRTAGSPDNAQGTHFFMINDSGTYYLRKLPSTEAPLTADLLVERAREAKVRVLPHRIDVPIDPHFSGLSRLQPVSLEPARDHDLPPRRRPVAAIHQRVDVHSYQPQAQRPALVDDRNFYRLAGVSKWVKNGFLNPEIKVPLGVIGTLRTHIEADLLLQNLMLIAEAMGLGAWIHASLSPPILLGDPKFTARYGNMLGFDFVTPRFQPRRYFALARAAADVSPTCARIRSGSRSEMII